MNPGRAGLVERADEYHYSGCTNYFLEAQHLIEVDTQWKGNEVSQG